MTAPRHLFTGSVANLRDLGGLRTACGRAVRGRRLLRSSALLSLEEPVADALTSLVGGPAVYADLRTDREIDRDGGPDALLARGWAWRRLPVTDLPADRTVEDSAPARYRRAMPDYVRAARRVAEDLTGGPVVVGCSLGKDRTGLVTALLLHWLGAAGPDIGADFELSNDRVAAGRHLLPPRWRDVRREIHPVVGAECVAALAVADALVPPERARGEFAALRAALLVDAKNITGTTDTTRAGTEEREESGAWTSR
ncbi:tyrosine-protein phosphatase [Streptomyces sp. URMC 123]|uniref:tyrosine-protein phosphatase n=1 Tax=Streptomyces sp. URMC 123 TaxID=3423403 RepID=UPI003F1AC80D